MRGLRKSKRQRSPRRRMDLTAVREALLDGRIWAAMGLVVNGDDGNYFEIFEDDVLVDVELVPNEEHVQARLSGIAGGAGLGIWGIPPLGTEVVLLVPTGEYEFGCSIVGTLSSGSLPDGIAPGVTVIANAEVLIHDGSGGTEPVVKKSEFDIHKHPTGVGPSGLPDNAPITGTEVLKTK